MGKVEHFEVPADEPRRARDFYAAVFGWTFDDWGGGNFLIHPGGAKDEPEVIGGDISPRVENHGPTVVVSVDSLEDTLASVEAAGGERLGEIHALGESGRYTYFRDSEGNRIGLFQKS